MTVLNAAARKRIPTERFGIPGRRAYPMPDRAHAANAKARAKQMLNTGKLSREQYLHIVRMANSMLGKPKGH